MPDSTNDYGGSWDLTIPNGSDSVDIVRDVGQLGLDVDGALDVALFGVNADTADTTDFSGATAPLRLYGTSRPDEHGAGGEITAPVGSTYTCVEPSGSSNNVYNNGARVWMKSPPPQMYSSDPTDAVWQVVDGDCVLITSAKNGLLTAAVTRGFIQIVRKAQSIYTTVACDALAAENIASDLLTEPQFNGMLPGQASIGYLVSRRAPSGDYATAVHIGYVQVGRGGISLRQETGAELGWSSPPGSSPNDFALGGQAVGNTLGSAWPTADLVSYNDQGWNSDSRTVEELRELITEIENDPEKAEQLEQLRQELEALRSNDE